MIYLDHNASTPLDAEVWAAMEKVASVHGNASSVHASGQAARRVVEEARDEVARLAGFRTEEVFFTSGGTEGNALALLGHAAPDGGSRRKRIVVSAVEHPSVRAAAERLRSEKGVEVVSVAPEASGALEPERVLDAVDADTFLVSVMTANNEYGAVFPVERIAEGARRVGALFHTDAVQAAGRVALDGFGRAVDLLTISAHKMHGPKGAGALCVRRGVPLSPRTPGGGQEKGLRAGTENTLAIAGFGAAARLARARVEADGPRVAALRDRLERGVRAAVPDVRVVGAGVDRIPNTSAVLFAGAAGEALVIRLDLEGVAASTGSACSSGTLAPSPALLALGLSRDDARCVVRFSLGRATTAEEIDRVVGLLPRVVADARAAAGEGAGIPAAATATRSSP